jgi:hypothetical protein
MRTFRRETLLYLLALGLGLAVRLIQLGTLPFTDLEAKWALQALGVAQGTGPALGPQPAYIMLTAVLFYAYGGGTNFLARLVPALVGSALVLAPRLFREHLKPRPAVILAFCLALEPGLVALSRQAGSSILAATFLLFTWGLWERKQIAWAGICAGLALLSGSALWEGLVVLALTWAILQAWARSAGAASSSEKASAPREPAPRTILLMALWYALGTILIAGSLFFLAPSGLSAWLSGLPEYLVGWVHPSGVPGGLMLFSLLAYQPLGLILALVTTVRGWIQGSLRVMRLSLWMVVALLVAVFYPAHQLGDLAWMLIPLWALASMELARSLNVSPAERRDVLGVIAVSFLILVFAWLNLLGSLQSPVPSQDASLRTVVLFGSLFVLGVSLLLVAVGWSARIARYGAVWGLAAALSLYSFSALMGAAGLRNLPDAVDMWRPGGSLPEADLLLVSVNDTSDWSDKSIHSQPVTIVGLDSPALTWLLHERPVQGNDVLGPAAQPPMVITVNQDNPTLAAAYRGQSFVWRRTPLWDQTGFGDWLHWLPFHQISQQSEKIILWVRSDLFIDSTAPKP